MGTRGRVDEGCLWSRRRRRGGGDGILVVVVVVEFYLSIVITLRVEGLHWIGLRRVGRGGRVAVVSLCIQ